MLSDNEIENQRLTACYSGPLHFSAAMRFARAIEAEVRKQDTELIRQMLDALDDGSEHTAQCITHYYSRPCDCKKANTISAARARLDQS